MRKKLGIKAGSVIDPGLQVSCARYSPCGRFLIAPGFDGAVHRWNLEGEQPQELAAVCGHHGWATDIAFHADQTLVVSADSWGQLRAWDYASESPEPKWSLNEAHDGWIRAIAMSGNGQQVATCGRDRRVKLFDPETGQLVREFERHTEDVLSIVFHPSTEWLLTGDLKGKVIQWEIATGKRVREFDAAELYLYHRIQEVGGVRRLGFAPDGKTLAVAGGKPSTGNFVKGSARLFLFDLSTGERVHEFTIGKENADVFAHDFSFHPSGAILVVTSGQPGQGSLVICHPDAAEPDLIYKTKLTNCHSISPHPDGNFIAVSSTNQGSNGNGRRLVDGKYPGNRSPIHMLSLVEEA